MRKSQGKMIFLLAPMISGVMLTIAFAGFGQVQPGGVRTMSELGCTLCHTQLEIDSDLSDHIPDLSYAGLRYEPAYLFQFLRRPTEVRRHISPARMPDFRLGEEEALAHYGPFEDYGRSDDLFRRILRDHSLHRGRWTGNRSMAHQGREGLTSHGHC